MRYGTPQIVDYGSITDHTFARIGGCGPKCGAPEPLIRDTNCEASHTFGVDQCSASECPCGPTGSCGQEGTCP
jgi:hypothetical protein